MRRAATTIRRRSSRPSGHGFGSLVLLLTGALCLLGASAPASPAAAATLDWSTVVWNDGDLTNTYTVGGVDVRITVSTAATGTFTDFGVDSPYEDGPLPGPSAFNFGCCLDLGIIFNPAAGQGMSTVNIDVEFLEMGTNTPVAVDAVSFEISDVDFSDFGSQDDRIDQVVITSDDGNPTLTAKTGTPSFSIVGNTATSNGTMSVAAGSENGSLVADFGAASPTTVNIDYNEASGNNNPGGRGIGVLFDLQFEPEAPAIDVEKATNGLDADTPPGPTLTVGDPVTWTYIVTNTGNVALSSVAVSDDQLGAITCPQTTLAVSESMTCTANGTAQLGQYANVATASGTSPGNQTVQDTDPSHYFGTAAEITLEKLTNGQDADSPPGPTLSVGDPVTWTYVVTNTGGTTLSNVTVSDDQLGAVTCPKTTLMPGETMLCSAMGTVQTGQYANVGTVTGDPPMGSPVQDDDPSHYFGQEGPRIDVEKATNGQDADTAPGPTIPVGDPITWTYVVTNTGNVPLSNVAVSDDELGAVTCPKTTLDPGESMTCTANGTAQVGQYSNLATATGESSQGTTVQDTDPSHYMGQGTDPAIDVEKATDGQDADSAPGPTLTAGDPVTWTYVVTNVGGTSLSSVAVNDDQEGAITCPQTTLDPGESMTCTATGTVQVGQYANVATATGTPPAGGTVQDTDPSHYTGTGPAVDLVKTAGDALDGELLVVPSFPAVVTYTYEVTNTGATWLSDLTIVDDRGTPDPGDDVTLTAAECAVLAGPLPPAGTATCTADIEVTGETVNLAVVTGNPTDGDGDDLPDLPDVTAEDTADVAGPDEGVGLPEIPTLGEWGLLALALLLALAALELQRRRQWLGG